MLRRVLCGFALILTIFAGTLLVYADGQIVFGPKELQIDKWHIHLSFHTFNVDNPGEGITIITKNTQDKEIRRGFILFNRDVIPLRSFLVGDDLILERRLSLHSNNYFSVFLWGTPGASITTEVRREGPIPPPEVTFTAEPGTITLGESSTLTWSTSYADSVSIDQGIGSVEPSGLTAVSPVETTTYTLTATGPGGTARKSVTVTVTPVNNPPVAMDDSVSTDEDTPVTTGDVLANDTDVDGDTLNVSSFTQASHGAVVNNGDGTFNYTPNPEFNGTDNFTYTVSDGRGGSDSATVTVTVNPINDIPVADPQSVNTDEETPVAVTLTGSDVDGDALTFTVVTGPVHGTLAGTPPNLTYTPNANFNGQDTFTFTVNDGTVASAPATVSITVHPINDPPVANDDTGTTDQDSAIDIDVLANDTDVDGDPLTVGSVTQGINGSTTINLDYTVKYTPNPGFKGTDNFTYTAVDGHGGSATGTVSVTVNPISPIALEIISPSDGDTVTRFDVMVMGTFNNPTGNETGITINGVLAIVSGNQFVANHVLLQEGESTVTATATDTSGNTATASITVTMEPPEHYVRITAETESGLSPLVTRLRIEASFSFTSSSLTYTRPGQVEILENPSPEEYRVKMTGVGIYYFTAEVKDSEDNIYTDTIAIEVLNKAELDTKLRAKWEGMRISLIDQNIGGALEYFHEGSKDDYRQIFNLLIAKLPDIASAMGEIEFIYAEDKVAKFRIRKSEQVKGVIYDITYYIYFVKDFNGLWRIESF